VFARVACALLVAAFQLAGSLAWAELVRQPAPTVQLLAPIVVEGQAIDTTAFDVDHETFSGFAKTIEREDFADRTTTLPRMLHRVPGLQIRETGGAGSHSDISLRGTGSKQVAVFLDGMLLNSAQSGQASLHNVPLSIIERIDIYPDAVPIQLGAAGLGGAIHLQTLRTGTEHSQASIGYGSFETRKADMALFRNLGEWNSLFSLGTLAADNDFEFANRQGFADDSHAVTERRHNNGFEQYNVLLKAGRHFNAAHGLDAMVQYTDSRRQVPTINNWREARGYVNDRDLFAQINYHVNAGRVDSGHRLYASDKSNRFVDRLGTVGLRQPTDNNNLERTLGVFSTASLSAGSHELSASIDVNQSDYTQRDERVDLRRLEAHRDSLQLSIQDNWQLIESYLQLNVSLCHSDIHDENESTVDIGVGAIADGKTRAMGNNWHLGIKSVVTEWLTLQANASDNLRAPSLSERYGSGANFKGNPELEAETSRNYDAGFTVSIFGLSTTLSWFEKRIEDSIVITYDALGIGHPDNIDEAAIQGIEFDLRYAVDRDLEVFVRGAKLDSQNRSVIRSEQGMQLPGIYHKAYQYGVNWARSGVELELYWIDDRELYYNRINNARADDRRTLDVSINWQASENLTLNLSASNVTDQEFLAYHRLSAPGRAAYLSANFTW
jgi:iron complex outermembrane receptor protein